MATPRNPGDGSQRLRNTRHEVVARLVSLDGVESHEAVKAVYDPEDRWTTKRAKAEARRICEANPAVVARITYLTTWSLERHIETVQVSREWVEMELVRSYRDAANDRQWSAVAKMLELLGTDKGMFVRQARVEHRKVPLDAEGPEDLLPQLVQLVEDALGPRVDRNALEGFLREKLGWEQAIDVTPTPSSPAELPAKTNGSGS